MQLKQLHALGAAQSAYRVLTTNPPLAPLANMPATFTQQVQMLGTLISQVESQATAQTSARSALNDKTSTASAVAKELRSGLLVPLRKMAKLITQGGAHLNPASGSGGGSVSAELPTAITVPADDNYHALIAAARAAVTNVTPYKDLFVARGMADDFLDQISAQADALTRAIQVVADTKAQRVGATAGLEQLFKGIRTTIQVLNLGVQRACKSDSANGPATKTTWETAKNIRKAPMPTDVPWPPSAVKATTAVAPVTSPSVSPVASPVAVTASPAAS